MRYVVGYLFVALGCYVTVMNIVLAVMLAKKRALNQKGYSPSRITLADFLPIAMGLPFITDFSFSMSTYIFISLPLALGLLALEEVAYRLTFRIFKRKNITPNEGDLC